MTEDRQQILAPDIAPDDAHATAERLRKCLRDRRFAPRSTWEAFVDLAKSLQVLWEAEGIKVADRAPED